MIFMPPSRSCGKALATLRRQVPKRCESGAKYGLNHGEVSTGLCENTPRPLLAVFIRTQRNIERPRPIDA
jgi:hypothetical protein